MKIGVTHTRIKVDSETTIVPNADLHKGKIQIVEKAKEDKK